MTTMAGINQFLKQKTLAVVGVSRNEKKFPYRLYHVLKTKGYTVYPVNPNAREIYGEPCYASILEIPQSVDGVVIVTPPSQAEKVVREAIDSGVKHIWIQQGAETQGVVDLCETKGINLIYKQCILMYAEPTFPHNIHYHICKVLGKLPE